MILGCIDIGSNTTRLLVADATGGGQRELLCERVFTRLGATTDDRGAIPAEKIAETAAVVARQTRAAAEAGAERVAVLATAVVRDAPNRDELAAAVGDASGHSLRVLSGDEEARLSFAGAVAALLEAPTGPITVADVGGGSTELAIGDASGSVTWCRSIRIGSGTLADSHLTSDPPRHSEIDAVRRHVEHALEDLRPPEVAVGAAFAVGGTATSTHRLVGGRLGDESLRSSLELLCSRPAAAVAADFDLDPDRVRLLPAGIAVLLELTARLGCPLGVAHGGLREGAIAELARRCA